MVLYLSEWFKKLILLIIVAALIDLLLPNSNFQKYARMVIGLLIILTLLSPILAIFNVKNITNLISLHALELHQNSDMKDSYSEVKRMAKDIQRVNQQTILNRLEQTLEQEIAYTIRNIYDTEAKVDVQLKVNNETDAIIDKIVVYLQGRVHKKDNKDNPYYSTDTIDSIPAVEIRIGEENEENVEAFSVEELRDRELAIRSYITTSYHLRFEQVDIQDRTGRNP